MLVVFFCNLGDLPDTETFVLTGAVLVKAATLWDPHLKIYVDKSTKDYVAHGGEPADVWIVNSIYGSEEYVVYGKRVTIFGNV